MKQPTAARASIILFVVFAITSALGYVFNIVLAWLLAAGDYGTYGVAVAILGILSVFIIYGLPWTVAKFLSEKEEQERSFPIFKSALLGNLLVSLVISVLFYLVYSLFLSPTDIPTPVIFVILAIIFISALRAVYLRALHGRMRFEEFAMVSITEAGLRVVVGLGLIFLGYSVAGALTGYLIGGLVALIIASYLLRDFKFWRGKGWAHVKVFSFAWPMFLGMLGIAMLSQLDILGVKFLSQGLVTSQLVGYYQAVRILALIPLFLAGSMMGALFPFISRYTKEGSRNYSLYSLRYIILFTLPFVVALVLLPGPFIEFFFPTAYATSASALRILAVGGILMAIIQVLTQIFQALGQPSLPAKVLVIAVLVQLGLLVILIPRFSLVGAAAAMSIASLFGAVWLLLRLAVLYQLKPQGIQIAKLMFALAVEGLILFLVPHSDRILIVLDAVLAGVVYLSLLVVLGLVRGDDVDILSSALPQNPLVQAATNGIKKLMIRLGGR